MNSAFQKKYLQIIDLHIRQQRRQLEQNIGKQSDEEEIATLASDKPRSS